MDFIEEKTPRGISLKIFLDSWTFLAFDKKGKSIYPDAEERTQLYKVPVLILLSKNLYIKQPVQQDYKLAKIRDNNMIIEYRDRRDALTKYVFLKCEKNLDMIPVRIIQLESIASLVRELDAKLEPDYIAVDSDQPESDYVIIKSKFKTTEIINIDYLNNIYYINQKREETAEEKEINLNMLSNNPVYLARIHLGQMDLSKVNQLLLDFDLGSLDAEYIYYFIVRMLERVKDPAVAKSTPMLKHLRDSFLFYMYLVQKNDEKIREMIDHIAEVKDMTPYQTLILKAKSMFPNREEQLLYTEYENMLMERRTSITESDSGKKDLSDEDPEAAEKIIETVDLSNEDQNTVSSEADIDETSERDEVDTEDETEFRMEPEKEAGEDLEKIL